MFHSQQGGHLTTKVAPGLLASFLQKQQGVKHERLDLDADATPLFYFSGFWVVFLFSLWCVPVGLEEKCSLLHWMRYLNTWSLAGGVVGVGVRWCSLAGEVHCRGEI